MAEKTQYTPTNAVNAIVKDYDTLKQMEFDGQLKPFSNYFIKDEDENLSQMRTEVVYDMSSSDANKNWGYTSGIMGGVIVSSKNFSKYSSLIVKVTFGNMLGQYVIDLNKLTKDGSAYDGSLKCTTESVTNTNEFYSISKVTSDKTTFYHIATGYTSGTTLGQMNNNSQYYVYKIEGILKTPAMIYTGAELHEGNGISIKDGVISSEHPIGSYHICATGSEDPASCFGGNWTQIASNIILPLGDTAFVDSMSAEHGILGYGVKMRLANSSKPTGIVNLGIDSSGMMYGVYGIPAGSDYLNPVFSSLYARLNTASNAIRVDIWRRDP